MTTKDALTGLLTRAALLEKLEAALAMASQKNQNLALVYADCSHLLKVNNDYGHVAGDEYIKAAGQALGREFQPDGFAGRIGGDEFIAVVSGLAPEVVAARAEKVCCELQEHPIEFVHQEKPVSLPVCIGAGIAFFTPGDGSITVDELKRQAYEALLNAKEAGGATVRLYSEAEERDGLTGLLKRYGLLTQFDNARGHADQTRGSAAIISLDIDEFDAINKQFGRYTGDEVLRRVAGVLSSNFKEIGHVGRYAGDEFVVVLPDSRAETAFVLAEEVRKVIEDTPIEVRAGEQTTHLTIHVSGGVAEYPSDGADWENLFRKADEAVYRAKRLGRNRICLPVSMQMVTKTSYFTQVQLEKLSGLAKKTGKSEAYLLREALDELLRKYE
jgi:diguanylate cyclase (GGDEF)-like protein